MKEKIIAIIPAAGHGSRMGADKNKLLLELSGRPVLAWTLEAFESCPLVDEVFLVANEQDIFSYRDIVKTYCFSKVKEILRGGETRAESVYLGLLAAEKADIVVVHDGARALVTPEIIEKTIEESRGTGAAIAAARAVDTVKKTDGGFITETPDRASLFMAQTPQVFRRQLLLDAMEKDRSGITDDASAVEKAGGRVKIAETGYENIKITTPFDLMIAEAVLAKRENA